MKEYITLTGSAKGLKKGSIEVNIIASVTTIICFINIRTHSFRSSGLASFSMDKDNPPVSILRQMHAHYIMETEQRLHKKTGAFYHGEIKLPGCGHS